jgi:hypothetical protein
MKKALSFALFTILVFAGSAYAGPFESCVVETQKSLDSGRFVWKPKASHFNQAVIVAPRRYFPIPPVVTLHTFEGKKIETAQLKSLGLCAEDPECLFAATFLTKKLGSFYGRKYGGIVVRFKPRTTTATAYCKVYQIPVPKKKFNLAG